MMCFWTNAVGALNGHQLSNSKPTSFKPLCMMSGSLRINLPGRQTLVIEASAERVRQHLIQTSAQHSLNRMMVQLLSQPNAWLCNAWTGMALLWPCFLPHWFLLLVSATPFCQAAILKAAFQNVSFHDSFSCLTLYARGAGCVLKSVRRRIS